MSEQIASQLPVEIGQLTTGWLTQALRTRAPGVTVEDFSIVNVRHGTSTIIRVALQMNAAGSTAGIPPTVMVKGGFEPHSRDMHWMYRNEMCFYRDVQPVLKLRSPICYFADDDPGGWQSIIIMEDLAASGADFCSALKPQSYEAVARRLTALAEFHSLTWDSADLAPEGRWGWLNERMAGFNTVYAPHYLQPEIWSGFVAAPRGAACSIRFHDNDWMRGALSALERQAKHLPQCLIHGDTHLGNLYVDRNGEPGFFDCLPSRSNWEGEVGYHITCALDQPDRKQWERSLIAHYLAELARCGVTPPPLDDAMRTYAAFLAYGYFVFLVNESFFQTESVNTAYAARFSAAMIDNDTLSALQD